jgi:hypothetical protein
MTQFTNFTTCTHNVIAAVHIHKEDGLPRCARNDGFEAEVSTPSSVIVRSVSDVAIHVSPGIEEGGLPRCARNDVEVPYD